MSSLDGITKNVKKWTKDAYADVLARQNLCIQYQRAGSDWHVALPLPPVNPNVYITEQKFVLGRDCAHSMPSFKLTSPKALGAGTFGVVVRGEVDGKPGASSSANATENLFHDCICPSLAPCQHAHMPRFMHVRPLIPPTVALKLLWSEYNQLNHKSARELYSSVRCDNLSTSAASSLCDWYGFTVVDASSSRCPKAVIYVFFLEFCPHNLSSLMKSTPYGGDSAVVYPTSCSMAARLGASILPVRAHFIFAL
jgi:hypothetical protein